MDIVGAKPITVDGTTRIAAPTPLAPIPSTPSPVANRARTPGVAASLAASPPVDADRVATIKKAIADGRFPILPATIADRLIALKLQWKPDEQA